MEDLAVEVAAGLAVVEAEVVAAAGLVVAEAEEAVAAAGLVAGEAVAGLTGGIRSVRGLMKHLKVGNVAFEEEEGQGYDSFGCECIGFYLFVSVYHRDYDDQFCHRKCTILILYPNTEYQP